MLSEHRKQDLLRQPHGCSAFPIRALGTSGKPVVPTAHDYSLSRQKDQHCQQHVHLLIGHLPCKKNTLLFLIC